MNVLKRILCVLAADVRNDFAMIVVDWRNVVRRAVGKPRICWDCKRRLAADGKSLCRECSIDWACT